MKQYYIQFDILYALIAACVLILMILVAWMIGYVNGLRAAERKFCNDYLTDALKPPTTPP